MLRDNLAGAHLADVQQARELTLSRCALTGTRSSDDRPPNALKIPARQGGIYALTENGASPLHAEPRQFCDVAHLVSNSGILNCNLLTTRKTPKVVSPVT